MGESRLLTGNEAVAYGVARAGAEVVAAYPITPQTTIIESLADLVASGESGAEYVAVESEHSAMAACIGAAQAGARAFTATSAQGLALMHEMLHWAAGARLPIVLVDVNRAMAPAWSIWTDQNDSLSQRDTGWLQIYCETNQEVLDSVVQAFALAVRLSLPVMVVLDAFVLSHTSEAVEIPAPEEIEGVVPVWEEPWRIDPDHPVAIGGLALPPIYQEQRRRIHAAHLEALDLVEEIAAEWRRRFGRGAGLVEGYRLEDAETVLVASATVASTAREVIDDLRDEGVAAGLLRIRVFRPFPSERVREALRGRGRVVVLDRNCSYGASGIFAQEVRAALADVPAAPPVSGYVTGLGGLDVTPETIRGILDRAIAGETPEPEGTWVMSEI